MKLNVNPTRMELSRLKKRHKMAVRGHDLLKDKQDEMMKKFIDMIKRNNELRIKVEEELTESLKEFMMAKASIGVEALEEAIMMPSNKISLDISKKNIMNINVPQLKFTSGDAENQSLYPYGYAGTSGELDRAIEKLYGILPDLLSLAEIEKSCQLMADEIEKTRRRVNALEYIMIPQLEETIKYITLRLEENERGNLTRLMKVKTMMENANQ